MISIIVPSYNQAEYLPECIDSVISQRFYCDAELIIVDDGSTDNSLAIAKKYESEQWERKNKGIKDRTDIPITVISQVNKGLSSARNTGIMNAKGNYILPLDADDMLCVDSLQKLTSIVNNFNPPDVLGLSFKCFGISDQEIILMNNPQISDFKEANRIGYCSLIKKKALLEVGGYSPKMTYGYEDLHLWFNLLKRGYKIQTNQEIMWMYRTKEKSMIHEAQAHHVELMAQIGKDFPEVVNIINNPLPR